MAWRLRISAIPYVRAYGECVLREVLPVFANLEVRADEIADAEFERLGAEPAGEECDGDMSAAAETAQDKGQAFYDTMFALRQTTLNLFAAGLFHLVEQQLADLCRDATFRIDPPDDTKLGIVAQWYRRHFDLDLRDLPMWPEIDELRFLANAVKHAEGDSAEDLRGRNPELFRDPRLREIGLDNAADQPLRLPLAGDDLYVTEGRFGRYSESANQFLAAIAEHFEANGEQYYPRGG
jgi:hypothetical protein